MMLKTNLRGQVRDTKLPESRPLLPLFEAVINAFQAIQEAGRGADHLIAIDIEREVGLDLGEKRPPITGFIISDTGVGFNDANFDSFNTAHSEYKLTRGGKGLGRFLWLKAFERAEIASVFKPPGEKQTFRRAFTFRRRLRPGQGGGEARRRDAARDGRPPVGVPGAVEG